MHALEARSRPAGRFTRRYYAAILSDPYFHNLAGTTLRLGCLVALAALALAYPLAVYINRAGPSLKTGVLLAVLLPKFTHLLVAMYGVMVLLANAGPLNRFLLWTGLSQQPLRMFANLFAVVVGETLIITPYPILILASALHGADRRLEEAARGLGGLATACLPTGHAAADHTGIGHLNVVRLSRQRRRVRAGPLSGDPPHPDASDAHLAVGLLQPHANRGRRMRSDSPDHGRRLAARQPPVQRAPAAGHEIVSAEA